MIPTILHDKKIWVRALLIACPFSNPLESCPLKDLRKLPLEDIIKLSMTMDEDKLDEIIEYHQKCLHERMKDYATK